MPTPPPEFERPRPPAPAAAPVPADAPAPRRWTSEALIGEGPEAFIEHAQALYRLRVTANGKLILTK